jgi:hypothetical protein
MFRPKLRLDLCTYPPLLYIMMYILNLDTTPLSTKDALELDPGSDSATTKYGWTYGHFRGGVVLVIVLCISTLGNLLVYGLIDRA